MKKLLLCMVLTIAAILSSHAFTVDGLNYSVSDGVATVTGATSKGISRLVIPATVTSGGKTYPVNYVGSLAFNNYTKLKELIIEDSDTEISCPWYINDKGWSVMGNPFDGCPLEKIYIGRNTAFRYANGSYRGDYLPLYPSSENLELTIAGKASLILSGTIPGSFSGFNNLTSLTIGGSVENIYKEAFKNCTSLKKITFMPGETELNLADFNVFEGCSIDTLELGRNINRLFTSTIVNTNVVIIKKDLPKIESHQVNDIHLSSVIIEDSETELEVSTAYGVFPGCEIDSLYYGRTIKDYNRNIANHAKIKHVTFGPHITTITSNFISQHDETQSVTLSENVSVLSEQAFYACSSLKEIKLPKSVTRIDNSAFYSCGNLRDINIPDAVCYIGDNAFNHTSIAKAHLPGALQYIGTSAFSECKNLKSVVFSDSDNELEVSTAYGVFSGCEIDSLYYGRTIKDYNRNIANHTKIKHVTFGPRITTITSNFISQHDETQSVTLSENVTDILEQAFAGCPGLTTIRSLATAPPRCMNEFTFDNAAYTNANVIVPTGTRKSYGKADVWKLFRNLTSDGDGFKVTVSFDGSMGSVMLNGAATSTITLDEDEPLTIAINPSENHEIASVTVNDVDVTGQLVDNMLTYAALESNLDIRVEFRIVTCSISLPTNVNGGRILIEGADGSEIDPVSINKGSMVTITLIPDSGHTLSSLTVNGSDFTANLSANLSFSLLIDSDMTIDVSFAHEVYTVKSVSMSDYGTVTLNGESGECHVEFGEQLTIKLMPRHEGCYLVSLKVNGTDVTADVADNTYTVENVETDMTVEAVFDIHTYTIGYSCNSEHGTITTGLPGDNGSSVTVAHGTDVILTIIPSEGFEIASVTLDGKDVTDRVDDNGNLSIPSVNAIHNVEATFDIKRVYLTVLGLNGGQIGMRYDYGSEVTLLIDAEEGWEFHSLTVGNITVSELDSDNTFTTAALTDDTDLSVVFTLAGESGVNAPANASLVSVTAAGHTITVSGVAENETVEVFDTNGLTIYRGSEHILDINRNGVHIVRVAGRTFKVMLR